MLEKGVAPAKRLREKDCEKFYMVRARSSAVEHLTFNQVVVGSIPTGLTIDPQTEFSLTGAAILI